VSPVIRPFGPRLPAKGEGQGAYRAEFAGAFPLALEAMPTFGRRAKRHNTRMRPHVTAPGQRKRRQRTIKTCAPGLQENHTQVGFTAFTVFVMHEGMRDEKSKKFLGIGRIF
jgi:hypothetical protein